MDQTNHRLATIMDHMADLLEIQRTNPHRIRAYRTAASVLSHLPESVRAVQQRGELHTIPGIGKELAGQIQEFLETGTIQRYESLTTPLPPDVADWTTIPGLSSTIVRHLYFRLGIQTLSDLHALTASHLLRTLPGIGASDTDILSAIQDRIERRRDRGEPPHLPG